MQPTPSPAKPTHVGTELDRVDSALLKGIAIFAISTHNFLHLVRPPNVENEFEFHADRFPSVVHDFIAAPESVVRLFLSYFGHYGVQIFIFLSAYGLTKSFIARRQTYRDYLFHRIDRVYPAFLLAILSWSLWEGWVLRDTGPLHILQENARALALKVGLVSNFVPQQALQPVGPWWFVPFIFQFYLVFPLLFRARMARSDKVLLVVAGGGLAITVVWREVVGTQLNLFAGILPHLPEFCLGIVLAGQRELRLPKWLVGVAAVGFLAGQLNAAAWYVSPLSALVLMLAAWERLRHPLRRVRFVSRFWSFLGGVSLPLFLVHGFLREPFLRHARESESEFVIVLWAIAFLSVAVAIAMILQRAEAALRNMARVRLGDRVRG